MRFFSGNHRLWFVCSAFPALGTWRLASTRAQASASASLPRTPGHNENGMQVFLRTGLKTHGPSPHDAPQFAADGSRFLMGLLSGAIAWANELPAEKLLLSC
jgi:hypothetical protein